MLDKFITSGDIFCVVTDNGVDSFLNVYFHFVQGSEYINITKNLQIEGRPIVAGQVYYTSGISEMLHTIHEPSLSFILHILKDSFDFLERWDTTCTEDTLLSTCDIKSFYTNIRHDVFYKAID